MSAAAILPARFAAWFERRGWTPHRHQLDLLGLAAKGSSALLIAPTGGGKTLAGFLPSLVELGQLSGRRPARLHTLYISPLKALAVDIERNLAQPVLELGLPIRVETRTGDTPLSARARQRKRPPDILLTTPEQLALLLASPDAPHLFGSLRRVVLDELHALVTSKRGDLLSLGLARLHTLSPGLRTIGLSATVSNPEELARYLVPDRADHAAAEIVTVRGGAAPVVSMMVPPTYLPWAGHSARHAFASVYDAIRKNRTTLVFVNTRMQAEMVFHALWHLNEDGLAIALHHGSLDAAQRRKVEGAMAKGSLRAIVCTSSLDLGIDWGDVDLVIHIGAPKGISRLQQRIGRANHRMDEPSHGVLVPANRFEVLECVAAIEAVAAGTQDTPPLRKGALDVLAQHILGMACAGDFEADALYAEVKTAVPYRDLPRTDFYNAVDFVATGGYSLRVYERFAKIRKGADGIWRLSHPRFGRQYRMNVGTIVEAPMLKVRLLRGKRAQSRAGLRGGRVLGQVEEYFAETLAPGDTFLFAGEVLTFEGVAEDEVLVSRSKSEAPKIPSYDGGKFPLSTFLAAGVRSLLARPESWSKLPKPVRDWLDLQAMRSSLPGPLQLLVETFPRGGKFYLVCYPFEGRPAHQTLGMLITRRLERARLRPMGFVATEYSLAVWCLGDIAGAIVAGVLSLDRLFEEDLLGDDLEAWLAETALMKRSFKACAVIAGLIERRFPGAEKTGRQVTISTDLLYEVLFKHQPDHILLRAARADAATGLLDLQRLGQMLSRIKGRIVHKDLERVSPLSVPVLLEIGREPIYGEAGDALLAEAADELIREAALEERSPAPKRALPRR